MTKFKVRKKPVIVEAYITDKPMDIHTLEGVMHASAGDYIITGVNGEQYPCKPDIFKKTYEIVTCQSDGGYFERSFTNKNTKVNKKEQIAKKNENASVNIEVISTAASEEKTSKSSFKLSLANQLFPLPLIPTRTNK